MNAAVAIVLIGLFCSAVTACKRDDQRRWYWDRTSFWFTLPFSMIGCWIAQFVVLPFLGM